jgi:hypothetical protein
MVETTAQNWIIMLFIQIKLQFLWSITFFGRIWVVKDIVQCSGLLDQFCPPVVRCLCTEDAVWVVNSFITIPVTRNYIHSQLFLTLCHIYTAYNHTRSWLQSLHSYTGWLLSYQLRSQIITHFTSSHFETLTEILLREFTWLLSRTPLKNWLCIAAGLQDISSARIPWKRSLYGWAVLVIS